MNRAGKVEPTPPEYALAAEIFDHFCSACTMKQILGLHREICNTLNLKPNRLPEFYPKLKTKLASSWKAQALFKKFDARANHKVYEAGHACDQSKALIIGAGPCGLRAAIECQLLGAKVVVVEKRDRMSRNNVLHLWPFVIQDLRALGAKKFFGKFCAGSIDHISIRQLQCILLKVALLLGVEVYEGVSFEELLEPSDTEDTGNLGWRARLTPHEHPVSLYEFDVLIGADGKRNTLQAFKRNEFRGKLALAITANFINRHTEQEASVPEINGVSFIFNQKFFKDLNQDTGIDLENIVYYKDDTHYFVMTAKKPSLLDKGVLLNDYAEISRLLNVQNVDRAALMRYAQEAAHYSTEGKLPLRDFALNHYGEPDVALFDFTSMYAAENASMVYQRHGRQLLCQLVGDSLLEPFWPTGSGCARGFLSALDAAWAVRSWNQIPTLHPLDVIAERESIYRLLAQTTPENLHRDLGAYTLDPGTRYPNLNRVAVTPHRVTSFYDSDDPLPLGATAVIRKRKRGEVSEEALIAWVGWSEPGLRAAASPMALKNLIRRYRPDLLPVTASTRQVYYLLQHEYGIVIPGTSGSVLKEPSEAKLHFYLTRLYHKFKGEVPYVHQHSDIFEQIKQNIQKEKLARNTADNSIKMYSNAADAEKSHSSYRKKRRSVRTPQVSNDPVEYIRKKIGKLEVTDIARLSRLIEGHDAIKDDDHYDIKRQELHEQIISLLDPEDAPDPKMVKDSIVQILQGTTKTMVKPKELQGNSLAHFFQENQTEPKIIKPPRKLKGLDAGSVKVPDFSDIFDDTADDDAAIINVEPKIDNQKEICKSQELPKQFNVPKSSKIKQFIHSASTESPLPPKARRMSEVIDGKTERHSLSPETIIHKRRSNSIGEPEMVNNTKRIVNIFEGQKRRHAASPESRFVKSGLISNPEMALRLQRMAEIIEGKRRDGTPSPDRSKCSESIGSMELASRRQRVANLIQGYKHRASMSPEPVPMRKNSSEMAFRVQRASDMMQNRSEKRPKTGKRKAAREIMKQRFEKSLHMLATEPRLEFAPSADLENDYGLQQYRANAPQFGERVKKLEKKLQHYEEGRLVGAPARKAGEGARVAQLAAELAGTTTNTNSSRASKPKDLMRSVGKIERDDWNVKEIERKITENRLGRPEPKAAERVPKWDREQFLGRQRKLKKGDSHDEKWIEIDKTLNKLDQKLRDSGRPDHGTKKVANLATKFIKKDETQTAAGQEQNKRSWRGPTSPAVKCAVCALRVFAAEGVAADGIHVHRSCFNCFVCKTPLKPGNYTTGIFNRQLFCLRHSGVTRPDVVAVAPLVVPQRGLSLTPTPERISVELSDSGAREIDEDEWTDRNFLLSETSGAGGLSDDDDESSSDEYTDAADSDNETTCSPEPAGIAEPRLQHFDLFCSEDSYGYDAYSDDGAESSGNESCSRMRAAREARRSEVPTDHRLPTDSSEVESEDESESSDHEISSATEVSTDSEFAREVCTPAPSPPAIIVTEINIPVPPTLQDNPLSRTRSTGGLATKRALELKRRYLLGESSPPAVRKSDSTSQLDTKLEAFRTNITEFQKLLHHSPPPNNTQQQPDFQKSVPDEVKKKYNDSPDMLIKVDTLTKNEEEKDLDSDSLSDDYSHIESSPNQTVPRLEVHNEGGELVQFDSIMHIECNQNQDEKPSTTKIVLVMESESFESCRDIMSLALAETELSDWATESAALDNFGFDIEDDGRRCKNPRTLNEPKTVHDAENTIWASHVCGRTNPDSIIYSNAVEHFQYADEGDEVPSIETSMTMRNEGYMEFVDDLNLYSPRNDRSITFVERSFPEMVMKPSVSDTLIQDNVAHNSNDAESTDLDVLPRLQLVKVRENIEPLKSTTNDETIESIVENTSPFSAPKTTKQINHALPATNTTISSAKIRPFNSELYTSLSENCPRLNSRCTNASHSKRLTSSISSPALTVCPLPLQDTTNKVFAATATPISSPTARTLKFFAPAICKSDSNNFQRLNSSCTNSSRDTEMPSSVSPSASPVCFVALQDTTNKVQKIKKEREEQTEVVRRLVLERLGSGLRVNKRSTIRMRVSPASNVPPPVPPLPVIKTPSPTIRPDTYTPPPRPALPVMPTPVTSSFSDPELARERRSKSIMKTVSSYLRRRLGFRHKWASESDLTPHVSKELFQATPSANEMTLLRYGFPHFPPPSVPPASSDYTRRYTNDTLVVDYMFKWLYDEGGGPEAHSNVSSVITESISENIAHRCMETRNEMSVAHSIGSSDPSGNSEVKYIRQWIQTQASEFEARKYCPSHENDNRPDLEHQWAEARRTMLQACRSEPNCPSASSSVRSEGSTSPIGIVNHETPVIRLTPGVGSSSARVVNNNTRVRQSTRRISSSSARIAKYETTSKRSFRPVTNLSVISFDNSSDNYGSNPASVCASEGSVDNDAHQEKWCLPINTTQFDTITETFTEPRADEEDNTQQPSIYEWLETELTSECKSTWDAIPTGAHLERVQQCLKRRLFGYKRKAINTLMKKSFDRCVARNSDGTFYSLALDREDFRRILYQLLQSFDYLNHGLDTVRKWTACRVARHNAQFLLILKEIDEDSVGVIVKRENFMKRKVIRELKKLIAAEMDKALKQLLDNKMAHNKNKKDTDCM